MSIYVIESRASTGSVFRNKQYGNIVTKSTYDSNPSDNYIVRTADNVPNTYTSSNTPDAPGTNILIKAYLTADYITYRDSRIEKESKELLVKMKSISDNVLSFYLKNTSLESSESQYERIESLFRLATSYKKDGSFSDVLNIPATELGLTVGIYSSLAIDERNSLRGKLDSLLVIIDTCKNVMLKDISQGIFKPVPDLNSIINSSLEDYSSILSTFKTTVSNSTALETLPVFTIILP